jgi:hypothetical protein
VPPKRPRGASGKPGDKEIIEGLTNIYGGIGLAMFPINQYDGGVILSRAQVMAKSVVDVAHHHKEMMDWLRKLTAGNDYMMCIMAHLAVLAAIAANHKLVPPMIAQAFGIEPPPQAQEAPPAMGYAAPPPMAYQPPPQPDTYPDAMTPDMFAQLQMQAQMQAMAAAGIVQNGAGASYDPNDVAPRPEQNPANLLIRRDA